MTRGGLTEQAKGKRVVPRTPCLILALLAPKILSFLLPVMVFLSVVSSPFSTACAQSSKLTELYVDVDGPDNKMAPPPTDDLDNGSDRNPGTKERPLRTIGKAIQLATAKGSKVKTIYIDKWIYSEDIVLDSVSNLTFEFFDDPLEEGVTLPDPGFPVIFRPVLKGSGNGPVVTIRKCNNLKFRRRLAGGGFMGGLTIGGGRAQVGGGIYIIDSNNITFDRIAMIRNKAVSPGLGVAGEGGGVWAKDSNSILWNNSVFLENEATMRGGGFWAYNCKPLTFMNCKVSDNVAGMAGGGFYFFDCPTVHMTRNGFTGNKTGVVGDALQVLAYGGAVAARGYDRMVRVTSENNTFLENRALGAKFAVGGGMALIGKFEDVNPVSPDTWYGKGCDLNAKGDWFVGCTAKFGGPAGRQPPQGAAFNGGGIHIQSCNSSAKLSKLAVSGIPTQFVECEAGTDGGAVHASAGAELTATEVFFKDNKSDDNGGAVHVTYFSVGTFVRCRFEKNVTQNKGGGLSTTGVSNVTVTASTFIENEAKGDTVLGRGGGALFLRESRAEILADCQFERNTAKRAGGAIWAGTEELEIDFFAEFFLERPVTLHIKDNVKFTQNKAETGFGGAVAVSGVLGGHMRHLFIGSGARNTVTFERNEALAPGPNMSKGGAIALHDVNGDIRIAKARFVNNLPTALQIHVESSAQPRECRIEQCDFDGGATANGGAHHGVVLDNIWPQRGIPMASMDRIRVQRHRTSGILLKGSGANIWHSLFRANGPEGADVDCTGYSRVEVNTCGFDGIYPYPAGGLPSKHGLRVAQLPVAERIHVVRSNFVGYWIEKGQYGILYDIEGQQGLFVNARCNWWGHIKGPHDPSNDTATDGLYNDNDIGSRVSDGVDYKFWEERRPFRIPIRWQ